VSGTLREDLSTCTLLTAVGNKVYMDNSAKRNYSAISMTTICFILLTAIFRSTIKKGTHCCVPITIMAMRTRKKKLLYSYIAYLVSVTVLSVLLLTLFEFIFVKIKLVTSGFGILTSNLLHLSSQIRTFTIFVTVGLQKAIYTLNVMSIKYQL
jgi:hypothetical protein